MFKFANQHFDMNIIQTQNEEYRDEIVALYIEAFFTGPSKQFINMKELNEYIDGFFWDGNILLALEKNRVIGALLYCPLQKDALQPKLIHKNFNVESCVYIAEMMVSELARGQGVGTQLLKYFFETVDKNRYKDAFIRVWDKNTTALNLYKKMGFIPISTIEQTKRNADGNGTFVMQKTYLHYKLA